MMKIKFLIAALLVLLVSQSSCTKHRKCECLTQYTNVSGVLIAYEEPLRFGVNGQYPVNGCILPGNPSQEEIEQALEGVLPSGGEGVLNPNGVSYFLLAGPYHNYKRYHLQLVNVALGENLHNYYDQPATYNVFCIEKE
ncbi:MAG: hypothetical protein IKU03_02845 [Bacteroidales bacterium]|nr:hypothetical protein [Bacteroidales bacterium]